VAALLALLLGLRLAGRRLTAAALELLGGAGLTLPGLALALLRGPRLARLGLAPAPFRLDPTGRRTTARRARGLLVTLVRHEAQVAAASRTGEDLEAGGGQLFGQAAGGERLGMLAIHGGTEQGVRDAPLRGRGGALALLSEERSGPAHERVERGALPLHRLTGGTGIAQLRSANLVDAGDEGRQRLGVGLCEPVDGPQRDGRAAQLPDDARVRGAVGRLQRRGPGVPGPREVRERQSVEFADHLMDVGVHGLSLAWPGPRDQSAAGARAGVFDTTRWAPLW
jgi:hypothetical protein